MFSLIQRKVEVTELVYWELIKLKIIKCLEKDKFYLSEERKDELLFKCFVQKPTDLLAPGTKRDFFKLTRIIKVSCGWEKNNYLQISVGSSYQVLFSFSMGLIIFLGFLPIFIKISLAKHILTSLIFSLVIFTISYTFQWLKFISMIRTIKENI